ncbi:universal stress protein [Streptomyces sp. NPDC096193]|uniref:universal stress protein n=1 Tax=Streptomyces sp. NPDC096193 TaxID=3155821 RepID=UPI00332335EE
MLRPVTAGVDGSPESLAAATWAADEARLRNVPLHLLHAWEWSPHPTVAVPADTSQRDWAHQTLRAAVDHVRALHPDLTVIDRQVSQPAVTALREASGQSALLVLGTRGISGFTGYLVGSVALQVIARPEGPIVLVRAGHQDAKGAGSAASASPREVVVGIDFDRPCDEIVAFAFEEARLRGADLHLIHAYSAPSLYAVGTGRPSGPELRAEREKTLVAVARQLHEKYPDLTVTATASQGRPAPRLLRAAKEAELLVLGRRRRDSRFGHSGPVTHAALHHAPCPVAVVPYD